MTFGPGRTISVMVTWLCERNKSSVPVMIGGFEALVAPERLVSSSGGQLTGEVQGKRPGTTSRLGWIVAR
jgi:hypothetical protein